MKYFFTLFIFLILAHTVLAQSVFNVGLIQKIKHSSATEELNVLVLLKPKTDFPSIENINVKYSAGNIYAIHASIESILQLAKNQNCLSIEYKEQHLVLMSDSALVRNRVLNVHHGLYPLAQSYTGNGVLIGIIDSGVGFNHPDLKNANGTSRVKHLWDMTKPIAANTPTAFGYGQEWTNNQIDMGLANNHSDATYYGHGTASSAIAAGNGLAINKNKGCAPEADLMVVAIDFNKSSFVIVDAVKYLVDKAQALNKPLVINVSLGEYIGSHDGTDLETQLINNLVGNVPGRVLVASAGNAGRDKIHVGFNTTAIDTNFTWVKSSSQRIWLSQYADSSDLKNVEFNIGVNNPAYQDLGSIGFKNYNYALNTLKTDTIYHNTNRIGYIESIISTNSFGVCELGFTIFADSLNYLWRIENTGNGHIDAWSNNFVTTNIPPSNQYPKISHYKMADTLQTICTGFQCSPDVITVGNYVNRKTFKDVNNTFQITNEVTGEIASNSSTGPTRQNKLKPDITASGNTIFAASDAQTLGLFNALYPNKVLHGGLHIQFGGTSASAPVVAGLIALYLQKNPTATSSQILDAITNCAYNDNFTTQALPNYRWGYGKLDAFKTMTCGEITNGVYNLPLLNLFNASPNPFEDYMTLSFPTNDEKIITIYNLTGEELNSFKTTNTSYVMNKNELASGIYILSCKQNNHVQFLKIMVL